MPPPPPPPPAPHSCLGRARRPPPPPTRLPCGWPGRTAATRAAQSSPTAPFGRVSVFEAACLGSACGGGGVGRCQGAVSVDGAWRGVEGCRGCAEGWRTWRWRCVSVPMGCLPRRGAPASARAAGRGRTRLGAAAPGGRLEGRFKTLKNHIFGL